MIDINNALHKAYYDLLKDALPIPASTGFVPVYEGEEPDNVQDPIYVVIGSVSNSDNSTQRCVGTITTIQIGVYGWALKYGGNARKYTNLVAGSILQLVSPNPPNSLVVPGIGVIGTKVQSDVEQNLSPLAGRKFCNRILIFSHYIYT